MSEKFSGINRKERLRLAESILVERLERKYPGQVLLAGIVGSAARGTDTPFSDLDMIVITKNESRIRSVHFLYRKTAAGFRAFSQKKLGAFLTKSLPDWPFFMGILSSIRLLKGDPAQIETLLELGKSLPREKFLRLLERELPGMVFESFGRMLSSEIRNDPRDLKCVVYEILFEMRDTLCLLNQRWVTHDYYQGLEETFSFPLLPDGYKELVPTLWGAQAIEEIVPLTSKLVSGFFKLLEGQKVKIKNIENLEGLLCAI